MRSPRTPSDALGRKAGSDGVADPEAAVSSLSAMAS